MSPSELGRKFIACAEAGDVPGARACMHADAEIWHNYDNKTQSVDQNMRLLKAMMKRAKSREYDIHRIEDTETGYVQRHTLRVTTQSGVVCETEALALVTVKDDKIMRIEEFLDPAPLAPLFAEAT